MKYNAKLEDIVEPDVDGYIRATNKRVEDFMTDKGFFKNEKGEYIYEYVVDEAEKDAEFIDFLNNFLIGEITFDDISNTGKMLFKSTFEHYMDHFMKMQKEIQKEQNENRFSSLVGPEPSPMHFIYYDPAKDLNIYYDNERKEFIPDKEKQVEGSKTLTQIASEGRLEFERTFGKQAGMER